MPRNSIANTRQQLGAEFVELLYDRASAVRRLHQLAATASTVQSALAGRGAHDSSWLDLLASAGEHRRLLVDPQQARRQEIADLASGRQLSVRVYWGPLRRMVVFDDRYAVVPLDQNDLSVGALLLRPPLTALCGQLFELLWSVARPLDEQPRHSHGLTGRELEVVQLLVQGATDHQVAHRLGVSSRTVRNIVSELQRKFGTTSRMALGYRLARAN